MNVTTIPVGSTGQSLEGVAVSTGVRESVILTSPNDPDGFAEIVSSQPINFYGLPVWLQGSPNVNVTNNPAVSVSALPPVVLSGTSQVFGAVSTQVVSSLPLFVAQSSAPWTMNGGVAVTNAPNVNVTNVPAVNITSSIPFFVAQSSSPWTVNISTMPSPSGTTMVNVVSTVAQAVNVTVTANNITSSIPFFVAQSSAPWVMSPIASSAGGGNVTSIVCGASLNTTVIKAGAGQIYSVNVAYFGSSNAWVKFGNASTAAPVSTVPTKLLIGMQSSTTIIQPFPMGTEFSTGIVMYTIRTPFAAGSGTTGILASSMTVSICYD
jgi:hypothetical protein